MPNLREMPNEQQLRDDTASHLQQVIAAMNTENFVVRPQRMFVEKFAQPEAWKRLGEDEQTELATRVPNGVMAVGRLYESPFLDISPHEPEGLFPAAKVETMVQMLKTIGQRAA